MVTNNNSRDTKPQAQHLVTNENLVITPSLDSHQIYYQKFDESKNSIQKKTT